MAQDTTDVNIHVDRYLLAMLVKVRVYVTVYIRHCEEHSDEAILPIRLLRLLPAVHPGLWQAGRLAMTEEEMPYHQPIEGANRFAHNACW